MVPSISEQSYTQVPQGIEKESTDSHQETWGSRLHGGHATLHGCRAYKWGRHLSRSKVLGVKGMDSSRVVMGNVLERKKRGSKVSEREQEQTLKTWAPD